MRDAIGVGHWRPLLGRAFDLFSSFSLRTPELCVHVEDPYGAGTDVEHHGCTRRSRRAGLTAGSVINQVIRNSATSTSTSSHDPISPGRGAASPHTAVCRHGASPVGWAIAAAGVALATLLLANMCGELGQGTQFLVMLIVDLAAAATGRAGPAITAALLASVSLN